jgi:hypothetical protein
MFKIIVNSVVYISLIFGLIGCTAVNTGKINSYVEVSSNPGSIKQVAIFSIRDVHFEPSESRQLNNRIVNSMSGQINNKIINSITSKNPEITIISSSASLRKINGSGLASEWNDFVEDYYNSGIANKKILYKISNSLGVDAVLLGQLISVYQSDGNGWDTTGTTIVTVMYSILEVSTAMTIWEVTADGMVKREMDMAAPPISEAIDMAIEKITQNVPRL